MGCCVGDGIMQIGQLLVVFPCREEDVSRGYGEDVEECEDVRGGKEEEALGVYFLRVRVGGDGGGVRGIGGGDLAEGAGVWVVFV